MPRLIALGAILFLNAAFCVSALASSGTGEISGKVLDPKRAAVAGASVKLVNAAGSAIRQTTADDKGNFQLEVIDPGEYQIVVESPGFVTL
jgi:hypothetical protein